MAPTNSSGALSLVMYPEAPRLRTRTANWFSGCMLKTSTGSLGRDFLISRSTSRPLRPGIVMSSTATSQDSFQTRFRASCALRASPKVARLNSSARICFNPWRTTAWSSAKRILMILHLFLRGVADGNGYSDLGPSRSWWGRDLEVAAQQSGSFAHSKQAHRARAGLLGIGNSPAVILYLEKNFAVRFFQIDGHSRGSSMADDIGQRFLEDAEKGRVQFLRQHR